FLLQHDALVDKRMQYRWERLSAYDFYLNFGFFSDVLLALCVTELFAAAVGGHFLLPEHGGNALSLTDRFVIGGIAAHLVRIVHSFVRIFADDFIEIEWGNFRKLTRFWQIFRICGRVALAVAVTFFVVIINNPAFVRLTTVGLTIVIVLAPLA